MAAPSFVSNEIDQIRSAIKADYEARTGRILHPAQVENLLIETIAYRESLIRSAYQIAMEQSLVLYAGGTALEELGKLVGVTRLAASPATVVLRFTLNAHLGVTIPAGTRVRSNDGQSVFQTVEDESVASGVLSVDITCECQTAGTSGNGYGTGTITQILDPQAFIDSVTNTTTSGGGADTETDDKLRERIQLAPSSFSVAGPSGAYEYFARTANPSIIDVKAVRTNPGEVTIYPLMEDGSTTPTTVLDAVEDILNDENIRPLSDTVVVTAPTAVNYTLDVELELYTNADGATIQANVEEALEQFTVEVRQEMGRDVIEDQIIGAIRAVVDRDDEIYKITVVSWSDITVGDTQYGVCTATPTVTITGYTDG